MNIFSPMRMKPIFILTTLFAISVVFCHPAKANTPIDVITTVDNLLRATSLADMISRAVANGADIGKVKLDPKLFITACDGCKLSNATRMLITTAYNDMARANGITVDLQQSIRFKINTTHTRNGFLRGALGVLSGADFIRGSFEGDTNEISVYSISHEMGFDEISQQLGEDCLKAVIAKNIAQQN